MTTRRPLDAVAIGTLVLLCLSWGLQQVAVKLALPAFPPMAQMGLRSSGAFLLVLAWCWLTGRGALFRRDGSFGWGILAGALFGIEFVLIYVGLQWTGASRSAIFIYTAPFFVALGARWLLPDEKLSFAQWLGLVASFLGVAMALGVPAPALSPHAALGDLMLLGAGFFWGTTTLTIKASPLRSTPPEKVLLYQLGVSALIGGAGTLILGETLHLGAMEPIAALLYQTVWVAGITFLLWFRLLTRYPAGPLQAATSMTPLFGIASAALVLGEPLSSGLVAAGLLVALGLVLVNRPRPG